MIKELMKEIREPIELKSLGGWVLLKGETSGKLYFVSNEVKESNSKAYMFSKAIPVKVLANTLFRSGQTIPPELDKLLRG